MAEATLRTLMRRVDKDHYEEATTKENFDGHYDAYSVVTTLSIALALYNSLEMQLLMQSTFKKWKGLYCWSLFISNWGVVLYALGIMMTYFELGPRWLGKTILDIGWIAMIVFQSLVLYSRLGLVLSDSRIILAVKWMIIINSSVLLPLVVIFDFGSTYVQSDIHFAKGYYYVEQIQLTILTVQELIISGLYVWKALSLLRVISKENTRTMIWQVFVINVIIISMDVTIITLEFLHFQLYQESIKGFVYSVKLKLELHILSKLVDLVRTNQHQRTMTLDNIDSNDIVGQAQAEIRREISWPADMTNWYGQKPDIEDKSALRKIDEGQEQDPKRSNPSVSQTNSESDGGMRKNSDNDDEITRMFSNNTTTSRARTFGRESDVMYADLLRAMK